MSNYDFHELDDKEFEEITRDLLQKEYEITFESSPKGRDRGIDLRYVHPDGVWIVQCKRYLKTTSGTLISKLRNEELTKVRQLNPKKYILVTSLELTPQNKDKIKTIFEPYIESTKYIYGKDDLNNLIGRYPDIEKKHIKLWVQSTTILERILRSEIYNESEAEKVRINLLKYVENPSLYRALELMKKSHFCIITGNPGIGKTFLAKRLIAQYLSEGFELIKISKDIMEARIVGKAESNMKYVFYYDDFLGNTSFKSFEKKEDSRIIEFIIDVSKEPNWRLIFTSREYIYNQAKSIFEQLGSPKIDLNECVITIEDYTKTVKAQILYNHILYSDLPIEFKRELLIEERYLTIIEHKNYSPRLIEFILTKNKIKDISKNDYFITILNKFDNPIDIWKHAFEEHISLESRYFLQIMFSMQHNNSIIDLTQAFDSLIFILSSKRSIPIKKNLNSIIDELNNCFISRYLIKNVEHIQLFDSSIMDYLQHYLSTDIINLKLIVESMIFIHQCELIFDLFADLKLENNNIIYALLKQAIQIFDNNHNNKIKIDYKLKILSSILSRYLSIDSQSIVTDEINQFVLSKIYILLDMPIDNIDYNHSIIFDIIFLLNKFYNENSLYNKLFIKYYNHFVKQLDDEEILNHPHLSSSKFIKMFRNFVNQDDFNKYVEFVSEYSKLYLDSYKSKDPIELETIAFELSEIANNLEIDLKFEISSLFEKADEISEENAENNFSAIDYYEDIYESNITLNNKVIDQDININKMFDSLYKELQ